MVTIIITYVDEHAFLAEAVQSALDQHLDQMELILVCNLPTLHSGYHPFPDQKSNIRFVHEPNPGSVHARNTGLRLSTGDWIQFLDVDDLILPDKIENQLTHAEGGAIVSPHIYKFINGTTQLSKWLPEDIWCGILDSGLGSTSSMLWHRETLMNAGGWNTNFQSHQEYELLFRLASSGHHIACVDLRETIVRERISGSITLQSQPIRAKEGIQLREKIWGHLVQHGLDTPARKNAFLQYIFRQLRGLYRRDRIVAMAIYKRHFPREQFIPGQIGIPYYSLMYRGFGFNLTERLFTFYSSVRDKYLPFLPINH